MADGFVLHPGHDELHGITVVVEGVSGTTYVGRWHERQARGVVLRDVATLPAGKDLSEWLARLAKFGVPPEQRTQVIPESEFKAVRLFAPTA